MIYLILGLIVFLFIIRKSNTDDLIKEANINTEEKQKDLIENILLIKSTKTSCILLAAVLISIILIALIRHTNIDLFFIQYFDSVLKKEGLNLSLTWYALPAFILIIRGIIIEVNIGDYIKKTYNLTEVEVDVKGEVKNLLIKKKPTTKDAPPSTETTQSQSEPISNTVEPIAPPSNNLQ